MYVPCWDMFFDSLDSMLDHARCEGWEKPDHVQACDGLTMGLCAESILEDALEEHHEDAWDYVDEKSLQALLDAWCEKNRVVSWEAIARTVNIGDMGWPEVEE